MKRNVVICGIPYVTSRPDVYTVLFTEHSGFAGCRPHQLMFSKPTLDGLTLLAVELIGDSPVPLSHVIACGKLATAVLGPDHSPVPGQETAA